MKCGSYDALSVTDPNNRIWSDGNSPLSQVRCNYNGFVIAVYTESVNYGGRAGMWFTGVVNKV